MRQGHDVTLFASGDSRTPRPAGAGGARARCGSTRECVDPLAHHVLHARAGVRARAASSTSSTSTSTTCTSRSRGAAAAPHVTTLHGRLDLPDLAPLYREFRDMPVVSISDAQRAPLPRANWLGDRAPRPAARLCYRFRGADRRLPRLPRPDLAREARRPRDRDRASAPGMPLAHRGQGRPRRPRVLRDATIAPLLDRPARRVHRRDRRGAQERLPRRAPRALLFPIDWPEPFGLVMIEAMACGTPVDRLPRAARCPRSSTTA